MKQLKIYTIFTFISFSVVGQKKNLIHRDWIKVSIENFSNKLAGKDSMYLRYSFTRSGLRISLNPGWNDHKLDWTQNGDNLKIGYDTYKIEKLDDTSLVIFLDGFRRLKFQSEEFLSSNKAHLDSIGQYNGKTLFKGNNFITPRYKSDESFWNHVQKSLKTFSIRQATHFLATFVVTEEGKVENIVVHKSIMETFDDTVRKCILKTSGNWIPARFKGLPIQTQMTYEIKYLDSTLPFD